MASGRVEGLRGGRSSSSLPTVARGGRRAASLWTASGRVEGLRGGRSIGGLPTVARRTASS
uniref:Uncharacterized protein n=1 Tax=Oryza barthii TaxID=65489 RepID=A0A0D3H0G5_9ORYZ